MESSVEWNSSMSKLLRAFFESIFEPVSEYSRYINTVLRISRLLERNVFCNNHLPPLWIVNLERMKNSIKMLLRSKVLKSVHFNFLNRNAIPKREISQLFKKKVEFSSTFSMTASMLLKVVWEVFTIWESAEEFY